MTPSKFWLVFKNSFKSCKATTPMNCCLASTMGRKLLELTRNRSAICRNVVVSRNGGTGARIRSPTVLSIATPVCSLSR